MPDTWDEAQMPVEFLTPPAPPPVELTVQQLQNQIQAMQQEYAVSYDEYLQRKVIKTKPKSANKSEQIIALEAEITRVTEEMMKMKLTYLDKEALFKDFNKFLKMIGSAVRINTRTNKPITVFLDEVWKKIVPAEVPDELP